MAGLTAGGFEAEKLENIVSRVQAKLETFNPGFDFSPDSPDGQLIGIFTYEVSQLWQQLGLVHSSYNPLAASGASLRNIGLLSGIPFGAASRSYADVALEGTAGKVVSRGSIVSNVNGDKFMVAFDTAIPSNARVVSQVPGYIGVDVATSEITTIETPIAGWTGVSHTVDGVTGQTAQTEGQYRNTRQATVMRNTVSVVDKMQADLIELGVSQPLVLNNSAVSGNLPDGTPPQTVHITVGDVGLASDEEIALTILNSISLGCPTYLSGSAGATSVDVEDSQGVMQTINFTKAVPVPIKVNILVTYLSDNVAGAEENIKSALLGYVNSLQARESVVWSRMFGYITPYAKAQVDLLEISRVTDALGTANITMAVGEYATLDIGNITLAEST